MAQLAEIYADLRKACDLVGGQTEWARRAGLSAAYVSDVLNARRDPGPKMLKALGYARRVTYHRSNAA